MFTSNQDQEYRFFDAQDTIPSLSVSGSVSDSVYNGFEYDVWVKAPTSVQDRKNQFLKLMSLSLDDDSQSDDDDDNRIRETSHAVLRSPIYEEMSSSTSTLSDSSSILVSGENFVCRGKNVDCSTCCKEDEDDEGCNLLINRENDSSPLVQKLVERQIKVAGTMARTMNRVKSQWLSRLRSLTCVVDSQGRYDGLGDGTNAGQVRRSRVQRVKVRHNKKRVKELSAVFIGQDIQAHQGSILAMKFSKDGCFLATGGEDGVVRIWQVVEDDRLNDIDIPDIDPSCIYFTVNHLSELAPVMAEKQKMSMLKSLRKTSDSACVIVPPKVFRMLEKPVHEFHGHNGEVLDLSWSSDNVRNYTLISYNENLQSFLTCNVVISASSIVIH